MGCKTMENKIFDHFVNAWKEDPDHPDDKKYKQINKCWLDNVVYYPNEIARTIMQSCIDDDGNRHLITEPVVIRYDELHDNDRANPDADDPTNYDNAVKSDCRYFKGLVDDKSYDNVKYGYPGLDNVCQQ
ncbi:MAG: hypothetical protein J6Y94_02725 [Bacteriovoracaceae bacterium]|nr:hypothetical protein [Bacteriovoracaceae bacterium]